MTAVPTTGTAIEGTTGAAVRVRKRDDTLEPYDADKINRALERAATGLPDPIAKTMQIASELAITLFDAITTEQLDQALVQTALQGVKDDPDFDTIACRLLAKTIYKNVLGDYDVDSPADLAVRHRDGFAAYVGRGVAEGLLDARLGRVFDLDRLAAALDPARDDALRYIGLVTMTNRYALRSRAGDPLEAPQYFWLRVAMGLSLGEDDPTAAALGFYDAMSSLDYLAAGSTLANAGTPHPQLSNCFVMDMQDDIENIAKTIRDVMWLTKGTGGIGLSVSKLRSEGSPIRSNNTSSTGPIPFMHTIDSILRAVSRGGKKFGALCFYMENWHLDFAQFLDVRQNAGDPYRRTRTANTAVWISDEFMCRVRDDEPWYLFDPLEVADLGELFGSEFSARYAYYVERAEAGKLRAFAMIGAREQFRAILISLQTTSHPWLTWKDTINNRALNHNTGTIHLSNLCTEICLPQDKDNVAVCNLASINLSRHLVGHRIDWERLARTTRMAVRQLDNLIDITLSAVPESEGSNASNRAVGLGVMGFTDVTERLGVPYASETSYALIDELMEYISWHAIDASADLARERGSYANFAGSGWSHGRVPIDTLADAELSRGVTLTVDRSSRLDWSGLRRKVAGGMRNSTLLAIAPTASIGLVAGTTPGLDPQFSQIFSRATSSGKFLEVNRNLVHDLTERGLWERCRDSILRSQGDLSLVDDIPDDLRAVYRTSFQVPAAAFVEVAARAQKWTDQAISRNIYLESRDVDEMTQTYLTAWEKGLKTTYYLHMKPRHTAEQSTVKVNKSHAISSSSRFGFGKAAAAPVVTRPADSVALPATGETLVCPTDPQERVNCEACQ